MSICQVASFGTARTLGTGKEFRPETTVWKKLYAGLSPDDGGHDVMGSRAADLPVGAGARLPKLCRISHPYSALLGVVVGLSPAWPVCRGFGTRHGPFRQDPANGLRRKSLPRTPLNKDKKRGRSLLPRPESRLRLRTYARNCSTSSKK
jgi:hypothetical protein